jgi:hypothetical protein
LAFDPGGFDDLRRTFTLTQHEARELGLRHIHRLASVLDNPVAQIMPGQHVSNVLHKLVNHYGRSASRSPYPIPNREKAFLAIGPHQQKQIEALTAGLQKVSAQLEASKPAPQVVDNNQ